MNPSNATIVMCALMSIGMVTVLYILIRAIAYHDPEPLQGSFTSDWGKK